MFYGSDNFGVGVGLSIASPSHHQSRYMADQTFHTPNFGDEEFDIPPMSQHSHPPSNDSTHLGGQTNMSYTTMGMGHPDQQGQHYGQMYLPEHMTTIHSSHYGGSPPTYTNLSSPHPSAQSPMGNTHMMHHQQQQHPQQVVRALGPPGRSPTNTTSPTSGKQEPNTSDDSDDSHQVTQLTNKRPSPEPAPPPAAAKKPKPQKKKKKRDPNEPNKPVSAYALFFRDTQAAIKGQNPNASFGEVSKIVASMWDALDADHKNVYKKKTEAAKKEYLKALAAYRASLVQKGAPTDSADGSGMYPPGFNASLQSQQVTQAPPPQQQQTQHYTQQNYYAAQQKKAPQQQAAHSPQSQPPPMHSPQQQSMMQQQQQQQQQMNSHAHMMDPNQYGMRQHPNASYMNQMNDGNHGMGMHMQQQHQQQPHMGQGQQVMGQMNENHNQAHGRQLCTRNGCGNGSVTSSEWDDEYCSSDCVVTHCRDVFNNWVTSNPQNAGYHPGNVSKFSGQNPGGMVGPDGISYVT